MYLTSLSECERAATALQHADTTAADDKMSGDEYYPPGCYLEEDWISGDDILMMNVDGTNTATCSSSSKCICKLPSVSPTRFPTFYPTNVAEFNTSTPTVLPTLPLPTRSPTLVPSRKVYELRTSGQCAVYITSIIECEQAAAALQLEDTTAIDDQRTSTQLPQGCYLYHVKNRAAILKVNVGGTNTGNCTGDFGGTYKEVGFEMMSPCLCKLPTVSPTRFPTFYPTNAAEFNSKTPTVQPTFPPTTRPPTPDPTSVPTQKVYELRT